MQKGLVHPPVNAPTLPEGYWWDIKIDRSEGDYWLARIVTEGKFGMNKRLGHAFRPYVKTDPEGSLNVACVQAYRNFQENVQFDEDEKRFTGEWSGQE